MSFTTIFEIIWGSSPFPWAWALLFYSHNHLIILKLCQEVSNYSRIILIKSVTYMHNYSGITGSSLINTCIHNIYCSCFLWLVEGNLYKAICHLSQSSCLKALAYIPWLTFVDLLENNQLRNAWDSVKDGYSTSIYIYTQEK